MEVLLPSSVEAKFDSNTVLFDHILDVEGGDKLLVTKSIVECLVSLNLMWHVTRYIRVICVTS